MSIFKMNTKKVTAKSILDTIESNLDYFKNLDQVNFNNDTLEDDLARVSEMLEKTQNLMNPNLIGNIKYIEDDLTVDQFDDELENFCKYSIDESVKSDNVYILDVFHMFVYIVDNMK